MSKQPKESIRNIIETFTPNIVEDKILIKKHRPFTNSIKYAKIVNTSHSNLIFQIEKVFKNKELTKDFISKNFELIEYETQDNKKQKFYLLSSLAIFYIGSRCEFKNSNLLEMMEFATSFIDIQDEIFKTLNIEEFETIDKEFEEFENLLVSKSNF